MEQAIRLGADTWHSAIEFHGSWSTTEDLVDASIHGDFDRRR